MTKSTAEARIQIGDRTFRADGLTLPASKEFRAAWVLNSGSVVEIDWEKARANFRTEATLTKLEFIMAAVALAVLATGDAVDAARGIWPASFTDVLAGMDPTASLAAQVSWASTDTIRRDSPLLPLIGAVKFITPEDFDTMFGYTGQ